MAHEQTFIDITDNPELRSRIAEAMAGDGGRVVLGTADGPLVAVVPLDEEGVRLTNDFTGLRAAAGSWQDEDADAMIAAIYEDRRRSSQPHINIRSTSFIANGPSTTSKGSRRRFSFSNRSRPTGWRSAQCPTPR